MAARTKVEKILFICGNLSPGHDGVGDYTRRLAGELQKEGVDVRMISWSEPQHILSQSGRSLRMSRKLPVRIKQRQAHSFLEGFNPDWVSLQFVSYSFNPKGLPLGFAEEIAPVIGSAPLHIFVHELWPMWHMNNCTFKARLMGETLQRWIVEDLLRRLHPRLIHAALPLYLQKLSLSGWKPQSLPIFGNIAFSKTQNLPPVDDSGRVLGFFGSIDPNFDYESLCQKLAKFSTQTGLHLTLRNSGIIRSPKARRGWDQVQKKWGKVINFESFGFVPADQASWYLQRLDWGISSYSPLNWAKSGTVAAMREHGLPVYLAGNSPLPYDRESLPDGLYTDLTGDLLLNRPVADWPYDVSMVAQRFLQSLSQIC